VTQRTTSRRITDHPDAGSITIQDVLAALADPVRRNIVCQLAEAVDHMPYDAFELSVGKSTKTHHFKVLRQAGLISQYYVGTSRMNILRRDDLDTIFPGLLHAIVNAARVLQTHGQIWYKGHHGHCGKHFG
jgi:DNA-binding transcriptional ArsR family regulator